MTSNQEPTKHLESPVSDPSARGVAWPKPIVLDLDDLAGTHQELVRAANARLRKFVTDLGATRSAFVRSLNIQTLMRHGWFPDFSLSLLQIRQVAEALDDSPEHAQAASEFLCESIRDQLDDIEAKIKRAFPNRSEILRDAFQAHRQEQWNLSVAVFLTQADGLFYDRFLKSLFHGPDRAKMAERIEETSNELTSAMLRGMLYDDWPLAMSRGKRAQQPDGSSHLNRHRVLHGEVTDYGTEENSLKAISLLNYCAFVLPDPEQTDDGRRE